ncbi:hypothetical protein DFQ29_002231 [Apophysomyces sp. BC1021]|nr:hypothetical protein DFQ29_002231 [Apophysomyces sp. BC1021]
MVAVQQRQSHLPSVLLNTIGFVSNLYGLYCVNFVYDNPYAVGFGGHFQYLTIMGLTTATLAFTLKLLRFLVPGILPVTYEVILYLAGPMEGMISLVYWAMFLKDPYLLTPKDIPPIPMYVDCALHLNPAVLLWVDFLIFNAEFKRSLRHVVAIYGFTTFYYVWSWFCQSQNGYWPYPFLNDFSSAGRLAFYLGCGTLSWIIYESEMREE